MEPKAAPVTADQAGEALRALMNTNDDDEGVAPAGDPEPEPAAADAPAPAGDGAEPAAGDEPAPAGEPGEDDVASLKARLADNEKRSAESIKAMQERNEQNQTILRQRFLQKATVADQAHKILKASRTEQGVAQEEVDRVIAALEGTMNPNSPSYSPPPAVAAGNDDQRIVVNDFLNEKSMTRAEEVKFSNWIKMEGQSELSPTEQQVAGRDPDAFLRIAYAKYSAVQSKVKQRDDAVEAARGVQITQRQAARAASATTAAPKKQSTSRQAAAVDVKKLTRDDVSNLLRQSVEQYR